MPDQTVNPPDLDDVLNEKKNEIFATFNCIQIGKIEKLNSNQTVEIKIQVKRRISGDETAEYPLLLDCPYFVLQGGGAYIDMPIKVGDSCLVLFNDRNMDSWWSTENVVEPADRRKHSLSDGIALIGINSEANSLTNDGTFVRILGTSGPGAEVEAARLGDEIKSTITEDAAFWGWAARYNTFNTAWIAALATLQGSGGTPAGVVAYATAMQGLLATLGTIPAELTGKITSSSSEVKIG